MKIETITRLVPPAASLMLMVCFASVGRAQQTDQDNLSAADKNEIVSAALRISFGFVRPHLALSSENLEFVDSTRMSEMGFTLVDAGQLRLSPIVDDFVVFSRIESSDFVVLSRVTVRRACFSSAVVSRERVTFTLQFHKDAGKWIGVLVLLYQSKPVSERSKDIFYRINPELERSNDPFQPFFPGKPNKSSDPSRGRVFRL
jgi:hypothetical protein